jgi:DNA-binding NtrC family response regulator
LAEHYLSLASRRFGKPIEGFSRAAMEALQARDYPGNVRELIGVVNNAALRCESDRVQPEHLGVEAQTNPGAARELCTLKENTERHVAFVYSHTGGDPARMSEILGVSVRQVQRRLSEMRQTPEWSHLFGGK